MITATSALILFFAIVTLSHWSFLFSAKFFKGSSRASLFWNIHQWSSGILWLVLVIWIILIQNQNRDFSPPGFIQLFGLILALAGIILVFKSFRGLGFKQAMGYRFFTNEKQIWVSKGIYSKLSNPMYDGFILIFVGLGLLLGITFDFILAFVSYLFLNLFLASLENKKEV